MASFAQAHNLPQSPDEQIRIGIRIIESAYEDKTRHLDHELQQLRAFTKQQQSQIASFERRVSELEQQVRDGEERARQLHDEKQQMAQELKQTQRDLSKLDAFKRSIMQSIEDEDVPAGGPKHSFLSGMDYAPPTQPQLSSISAGAPPYTSPAAPPPVGNPLGSISGLSVSSVPTGGAAFATTTPAPPVTGSPTGEAPPNAAAVLDGKDFFRQARLRLTYEQFNQFLTNIKRLNDHAQPRSKPRRPGGLAAAGAQWPRPACSFGCEAAWRAAAHIAQRSPAKLTLSFPLQDARRHVGTSAGNLRPRQPGPFCGVQGTCPTQEHPPLRPTQLTDHRLGFARRICSPSTA